MDVQKAYSLWADQYDTNENKTRDLEAVVLKNTLAKLHFHTCLEIGCGTGKNTKWLATKARHITAIDLTEEMLTKAKEKVQSPNVSFLQFDITKDWSFTNTPFDLITFSLVLEHIENIGTILKKASNIIRPNGYVYIGELHPYKQYTGSKARFETNEGLQIVNCYLHHISDFAQAAQQNHFSIIDINEYFDEGDRTNLPRILMILLQKDEE